MGGQCRARSLGAAQLARAQNGAGAELFMSEHAMDLPTMTEVARAVGTSLRTLSEAFKTFRGYSPSAYLREQRLQGVRRDLLSAPAGSTVGEIAGVWGYVNPRRVCPCLSAALRRIAIAQSEALIAIHQRHEWVPSRKVAGRRACGGPISAQKIRRLRKCQCARSISLSPLV